MAIGIAVLLALVVRIYMMPGTHDEHLRKLQDALIEGRITEEMYEKLRTDVGGGQPPTITPHPGFPKPNAFGAVTWTAMFVALVFFAPWYMHQTKDDIPRELHFLFSGGMVLLSGLCWGSLTIGSWVGYRRRLLAWRRNEYTLDLVFSDIDSTAKTTGAWSAVAFLFAVTFLISLFDLGLWCIALLIIGPIVAYAAGYICGKKLWSNWHGQPLP